MKESLRLLRGAAVRLHRDDRGAEGLEKLLILAALVLPLLGLLIWFRDDITTWVKDIWETQKSDAEDYDPNV